MSLKHFVANESIADLNDPQPVEYIAPDMSHQSVEVSQSPEMIDAEADVDGTLVKIVNAEEAQVALEQYTELLKQYEATGISEQSAAFLRVGLEHFEHVLGLDKPLTPSMEAFGGTASRRGSTRVSLESLKEKSKDLLATLKALFKQLMEYAVKVYHTLTMDAERLKATLEAIRAQLTSLPDNASQTTVEISNPASLMIGNVFKGQDPAILAGVIAYGAKVYPNDMKRYIGQLAKTMGALNPAEVSMETLKRTLDGIPGVDKNYRGAAQVLPGNVKLTFVAKEDGQALTKSLNNRLAIVKATPGQVASVTVTVATRPELAARAQALARIIDGIIEMGRLGDTMNIAVADLLKAAERAQNTLDEGEVSGEAKKATEDLLKSITVIPKMVAKDGVELVQYCYRTTGAYIAVLKHEIAAYK